MRTNMTTLTQIQMTLLLSNILPSDRNANLPLQKYQLVCVVPTWVSMHIVQLISDTIYCLQGSHPQETQWTRKSPTGPWGFQLWLRASISPTGCPYPPGKVTSSQVSMHIAQLISDFIYCLQGSRLQDTQWTRRSPTGSWSCQALITGLCQFYRVPVTSSKGIRPPTDRAFIKKYCVPRQAQGETPQQHWDGRQRAIDTPPPPLEFTSAHPQKGQSVAYDTWPTSRLPSPKPKVSKVLGQ